MRRATRHSCPDCQDTAFRQVRETLFLQAYPLARRAAQVRSVSASASYTHLEREDIEQEMLLSIWVALPRFERARASLRTFIERVAANSLASALRREAAKKRTWIKGRDSTDDPPTLFLQIEVRLDFHRAMEKLSQTDMRVLELLMEDGPARIARTLGISRPAVYRSINRIRTALTEAGFGNKLRRSRTLC